MLYTYTFTFNWNNCVCWSGCMHSCVLESGLLQSFAFFHFKFYRPHLQSLEGVRKGLHPDKEGGYDDGWGVVGAVVALCQQLSYRVKVYWIKQSKREQKRRMKNKELKYAPSPSVSSTSSYLWMNICLLLSVWAPIGFDRSRNVAGIDRLRV